MEAQQGRSEAGLLPKLLKTGSVLLCGDHPAFLPGVCSRRHQMLWQDTERCHLRGKPILREQSQSVVEPATPSRGGGISGQESKAGWGEGPAKHRDTLISYNQLPPVFVLLEISAMFIECSLYMYHLILPDTMRCTSSQHLFYR